MQFLHLGIRRGLLRIYATFCSLLLSKWVKMENKNNRNERVRGKDNSTVGVATVIYVEGWGYRILVGVRTATVVLAVLAHQHVGDSAHGADGSHHDQLSHQLRMLVEEVDKGRRRGVGLGEDNLGEGCGGRCGSNNSIGLLYFLFLLFLFFLLLL
ncbi:hypothetical protein PFISCL1PPCAC_303, partial [Pristionchus fissidentatus]